MIQMCALRVGCNSRSNQCIVFRRLVCSFFSLLQLRNGKMCGVNICCGFEHMCKRALALITLQCGQFVLAAKRWKGISYAFRKCTQIKAVNETKKK